MIRQSNYSSESSFQDSMPNLQKAANKGFKPIRRQACVALIQSFGKFRSIDKPDNGQATFFHLLYATLDSANLSLEKFRLKKC